LFVDLFFTQALLTTPPPLLLLLLVQTSSVDDEHCWVGGHWLRPRGGHGEARREDGAPGRPRLSRLRGVS
jgi:hypothetical protein